MTGYNYSYELHEYDSAFDGDSLRTKPPSKQTSVTDDFSTGYHFRTKSENGTNYLVLDLEDRELDFVLDESGSMTWNDRNADRYAFAKRLAQKLAATYPAGVTANLIGVGGVQTRTNLFVTGSNIRTLDLSISQEPNADEARQGFERLISSVFENSIYDFAGVRLIRRTDRFPAHPSDGVLVYEGVVDAIKDESLQEGQTYYYGIWSFNANHHFGDGQFFMSVPRKRIVPNGVSHLMSTVRRLPGVERDDHTKLIYNFSERSGLLVFDSSGFSNHASLPEQTIESSFWLGDGDCEFLEGRTRQPVGVRFDGQYDLLESLVQDDLRYSNTASGTLRSLTVNFWVYRLSDDAVDRWIMGTSTYAETDNIGWAFGLTATGALGFSVGSIAAGFASTGISIPLRQWTHIVVVMDDTWTFYVDGSPVYSIDFIDPINNVGMDYFYVGAKPTNEFCSWSGKDFFGVLNYVNIHNVARDSDYIYALDAIERASLNRDIQESLDAPLDNGQRDVLLHWETGRGFNYPGGSFKIVRKYGAAPAHDADGTVVYSATASEGSFYFLDADLLVNRGDYYYRIFTYNILQNACEREDARIAAAHIFPSVNQPTSLELMSVEQVSVTPGNHKLMLQWQNPVDARWVGTKVYASDVGYPVITLDQNQEIALTVGSEVCDTTGGTFIYRFAGISTAGTHCPPINGKPYYFTLACYDRRGNLSEQVNAVGVPQDGATAIFPPASVSDFHSVLVNQTSLSIQWLLPSIKSETLRLWMGEVAQVYANIREIYGGGLDDLSQMKLIACTTATDRKLQSSGTHLTVAEAPNEGDPCAVNSGQHGRYGGDSGGGDCNHPETELIYSNVASGLIVGFLTHKFDPSIIARREKYTMNVQAVYNVSREDNQDPFFTYQSEPVQVVFTNPLRMSLVNQLDKKVPINELSQGRQKGERNECEQIADDNQGTKPPTIEFTDGGFCKATQPYVVRVEVQYKGGALPDGYPVNVSLFRSGTGQTIKTTRTTIREGDYPTRVVVEDVIVNGQPTGATITKSVVDIPLFHPRLPDVVDVYVTVNYQGFLSDSVHTILFRDSLFIELQSNKPAANGIDVGEQFANVWQLDPDNPSVEIPAPDGTVIKWTLAGDKPRPFYSTEALPNQVTGVYSMTRSGVARNVFFGPISNIESHWASQDNESCCIGEDYIIQATVTLDEETASDAYKWAYRCDDRQVFTSNVRLLMDTIETVGTSKAGVHAISWADGEHLIKFSIAKNPAIASVDDVPYAQCFRDCIETLDGGQYYPLAHGHLVTVTGPAEILWNVTFEEDPYTGALVPTSYDIEFPEMDADGFLKTSATAKIPITDDVTDFYMRLNARIGSADPIPQECVEMQQGLSCEFNPVCSGGSCPSSPQRKYDNVTPISAHTSMIVGNKAVTIYGGGDYKNGIPPVYIGWKEPLHVTLHNPVVNGNQVSPDHMVFDGVSRHTFPVEISFAGCPVPNGTEVELQVSGSDGSPVRLSNCDGINNCSPSSSGIIRTQLVNDPFINPPDGEALNGGSCGVGNRRSIAYFTIDPIPNVTFSATIKAICRHDKVGTIARAIVDKIDFANNADTQQQQQQGGESGSENPQQSEEASTVIESEVITYNPDTNVFGTLPPMGQERYLPFCAALELGSIEYICTFGGKKTKGLNATSQQYDPLTNKWNMITPMPTPRCAGQTVVVGSKVYCIGGVEFNEVQQQYRVSNVVEVYDANSEHWITSLSSMPNGIAFGAALYADGFIYIVCGAKSVTSDISAENLNDKILRYSIADDGWVEIDVADVIYPRLSPVAFRRSCTCISDGWIYVMSGAVPKTPGEISSERTAAINNATEQIMTWLYAQSDFQAMSPDDQNKRITEEIKNVQDSIEICPFTYPQSVFKFQVLGGLDLPSMTLLQETWPIPPRPVQSAGYVYLGGADCVITLGGSNQNISTTLDDIDMWCLGLIDDGDSGFAHLGEMPRGKNGFGVVFYSNLIVMIGGITSGHQSGWVSIEILQTPDRVEAMGKQSAGLLIQLKNDAGKLIREEVRVSVRGRLSIPEVDARLTNVLADIMARRALGDDGSGIIPDLPNPGDLIDWDRILREQAKISNLSGDNYQMNSARRLAERLFLMPVLYDRTDFTVTGVGGALLLPRSEDPFYEFSKLAALINERLRNIPPETDETFDGSISRYELEALAAALNNLKEPTTEIKAGTSRDLYDIETIVTVIDSHYFGETISQFDTAVSGLARQKIQEYLTPPLAEGEQGGGSSPPPTPEEIGNNADGQGLGDSSLIPAKPSLKSQNSANITTFYNIHEWLPRIKKYLVDGHTVAEVASFIESIEDQVPFGPSQLYDGLKLAAEIAATDPDSTRKKVIYVLSDNSENLSIASLSEAIDAVNSIDGDRQTPVLYTLFNTSFPLSLTAELEQTDASDVEQIVQATGGQSTVLLRSDFLNSVLNRTLGAASGGMGYGLYRRSFKWDELSAITTITPDFVLPDNTVGYLRYRHSSDGYNFSDWSEKFEGANTINFDSLFAKAMEVEITLATAFTTNDANLEPTGSPKLRSITWETSGTREDFIFLEIDDTGYTVEQLAAAFEGSIPMSSVVEIGVATSDSHDWRDFQSDARPAIRDFGKQIQLVRAEGIDSGNGVVLHREPMTSTDGLRYDSTYGRWNPESAVKVYEVTTGSSGDVYTQIYSGFEPHSREGYIYFSERKSLSRRFALEVQDAARLRVALRLRNRLWSDAIDIQGLGYLYSTTRIRPPELSQAAPIALEVDITPRGPTVLDTVQVTYNFEDINGNPEVGTKVRWYKNGMQIIELQDKKSWKDADLLEENKLFPNDKLYVVVTPSDGRLFGTPVQSGVVTVQANPPSAINARLLPYKDNLPSGGYDTSSTIVLAYDFHSEDAGDAGLEIGTTIRWYVNGAAWKTGSYSPGLSGLTGPAGASGASGPSGVSGPSGASGPSGQSGVSGPSGPTGPMWPAILTVTPEESVGGVIAVRRGNSIYAEVSPRTALVSGETVRTAAKDITNTIPRAINVRIDPEQPTNRSTLRVLFDIVDVDLLQGGDPQQAANHEITWYKSVNGGLAYQRIDALSGYLDAGGRLEVPPVYLDTGQLWKVKVKPCDGLDCGQAVESTAVLIRAS